jgi:hypothetical protein
MARRKVTNQRLPRKISPVSLGASKKQNSKNEMQKDVYYIDPVLYTISAGDTSTYGANRDCSKPQLSSYACVEPPNHTCSFPPSMMPTDQTTNEKQVPAFSGKLYTE